MRRALLGLPFALCVPRALAQTKSAPEPVFGTPGKDAGWIPTPNTMVEPLLKLAGLSSQDLLVDLGSGDGRIPILAAKQFGARGLGVEFNGDLVSYSRQSAEREGVASRVRFVQGDIFKTDFSDATVVAMFMTPTVMNRLKPQLLAMKPGTRVVSYLFALEGWEPDEWVFNDGVHGMLWIVPAQMQGTWKVIEPAGENISVRLEQKLQRIDGRLLYGSAELPLFDARLRGDRVGFTALAGERRMDFTGTVRGTRIEGEMHMTGQPQRKFVAQRM